MCCNLTAIVQATESVKKIINMIRVKDFEANIMAMLTRLMQDECQTSKFAAIQLFPCVYTHFAISSQQDIMNMYY